MGNNNSIALHLENAKKTGICSLPKREFKKFPDELLDIVSSLRSLDLSDNKLLNLPSDFNQFSNLKYLNCQKNRIKSVPSSISSLSRLETLILSHNTIDSFPDCVASLSTLKTVNISYNNLSTIPDGICKLKQLDSLDLSNNRITELPTTVAELTCSELNLNNNQMSCLPGELAACRRLRTLRVEHNVLVVDGIPESLLATSNVSLLLLDGNRFEQKQLAGRPGFSQYMERYTATKKKL